jgi:hypothetical protein
MAAPEGRNRLHPVVAAALAAAVGFASWALFASGEPGREAWDSPLWWSEVVPALSVTVGILGALLPNAVWRWSTAAMVGQLLAMIVLRPSGTDLGLLPLAIIFVLVPMAILLTIPALIGGMIARRGWHADLI